LTEFTLGFSKVLFGPISKIIGQDAKSVQLPTIEAGHWSQALKVENIMRQNAIYWKQKGNPFKAKSTGLSHNGL